MSNSKFTTRNSRFRKWFDAQFGKANEPTPEYERILHERVILGQRAQEELNAIHQRRAQECAALYAWNKAMDLGREEEGVKPTLLDSIMKDGV